MEDSAALSSLPFLQSEGRIAAESKVLADILASLQSVEKIVLRVEDKLNTPISPHSAGGYASRNDSRVPFDLEALQQALMLQSNSKDLQAPPSEPDLASLASAEPPDLVRNTSGMHQGRSTSRESRDPRTPRGVSTDNLTNASQPTATPRLVLRRRRGSGGSVQAGSVQATPSRASRNSRSSSKGSGESRAMEFTKSKKMFWDQSERNKLKDSQWPACLKMRAGMEADGQHGGPESKCSLAMLGFHMHKSMSGDYWAHPNYFQVMHPGTSWLPLDPDTWFCILLQWLRLCVLLFDTLLTPVILAWSIVPGGALFALEVLAAVYFIIDCCLHFATGYYHDGDFVRTWKRIAKRYARTWLSPDVVLVLVDWVIIITDVAMQNRRSLQRSTLADITPWIRLIKLFRLTRVVTLFRTLASGVLIRGDSMSAHSLTIPFALIIYNHLVCCCWGWVGLHEQRERVSWLDQAEVVNESTIAQYLASLHWTIAQMTPGPIDIVARTDLERTFNCIILVCGLLYGSIIISQFSGQIMQLTMLQRGKMQKLDHARLFLNQRQVRRTLAVRIQTQVRKRIFEDAPLQFSQVPAFDILASSLRLELLLELRLPPVLSSSMLFRIWWSMAPSEVANVCAEAIDFKVLMPQDELFEAGKPGQEAYLLLTGGVLTYVQEPASALVPEREETAVSTKTWFCEAAVWSDWNHVGTMYGARKITSELLVLRAPALLKEVTKEDSPGRSVILHYGRQFYLRLITAMPPFTSWPSDLHVPDTDVGNLVGIGVGLGLLNTAMAQNTVSLTDDAHEALLNELAEEKCALRAAADGSLERTVAVVAVRLVNLDDEVLVQLARCENGKDVKVNCALPGIKRGASELPEQAFSNLLQRRLPDLSGSITVDSTKYEVKQKNSEAYGGMPTIYQRYEILAFLEGDSYKRTWKKMKIGDQGDWLGIDELYCVDDETAPGFYVFAWLDAPVANEFLSSERRLDGLNEWLQQFDFETATTTEADELENYFGEGLLV